VPLVRSVAVPNVSRKKETRRAIRSRERKTKRRVATEIQTTLQSTSTPTVNAEYAPSEMPAPRSFPSTSAGTSARSTHALVPSVHTLLNRSSNSGTLATMTTSVNTVQITHAARAASSRRPPGMAVPLTSAPTR
jgi:hypothetical protein